MKDLFPEFSLLSDDEISKSWDEALFVFDTNVLLDLYRFRESSRLEFITVIESLNGRIWIPYHVALEFYRNRLGVISSVGNVYADLPTSINQFQEDLKKHFTDKKLFQPHSTIDPTEFLEALGKLKDEYFSKLDALKLSQSSLRNEDILREKIESLFDGKVGHQNKNQKDFDNLFTEAESRFLKKIPPGFRDDDKKNSFLHNGIAYPYKYGDYIIWTQILEYIKSINEKKVIFVTADVKEDWFQKESGKTIGPRMDLINEAHTVGGVDFFYIYNSKRFLEHASNRVNNKVAVSQDTISDVVAALKARAEHGPVVHTKHSRSFGVVSIYPEENKLIDIDRFNGVTIKFSNPIDRSTVNNIDTIFFRSRSLVSWGAVTHWYEFADDDKTLLWRPDLLAIRSEYDQITEHDTDIELFQINLGGGYLFDSVKDIYGNILPKQSINFKFHPPLEFLL